MKDLEEQEEAGRLDPNETRIPGHMIPSTMKHESYLARLEA